MSIPSWAVKGAKVVCIADNWDQATGSDPAGLMQYPERGPVYTVREVRVRYVSEYSEVLVGIVLAEIVNPHCSGGSATGEETAFDIRCFRPLVKRAAEQDLAEHFAQHLRQPAGVDA